MTAPVIPGPDESGDATGGDPEQGSESGDGQDTGDTDIGQDNPDEPMTNPGVKSVSYYAFGGKIPISETPSSDDYTWWEPAAYMNLYVQADNPEAVQVVEFEMTPEISQNVVVFRFVPTGIIDGNEVEMVSEIEVERDMWHFGFVKVNGYPYRTIN